MAMRSILKYLGLFRIAVNLINQGAAWLDEVKDEDSPGGEDITAEEYLDLVPIIEQAILDGIGIAVRVKIEPE